MQLCVGVNVVKYDVVIAGSGIAGASAAYFLSRKGFKVLFTDVKPFERAGDKPCGDAMGKHHFDELGIEYPKGEELEGLVKAIDIYSPSEEIRYRVTGEGFEVNRVEFTKRFIRLAQDKGAEYLPEVQVRKLLFKNGRVVGASLWSRSRGEWEVEADLVIDATGMSRALLRQVPQDWPIRDDLRPQDMNIAYREIRKLKEPVEEPEILRIYVSQKKAPGGYWWFFPYSLKERVVNVGLGVQGGMGHPFPKDLLYTKVLNSPIFEGSEIIEAGGAAVPTRRPINTLVWEGIAAVGDAAYTVNPIHGGGKGSAMLSSWCIAEAVEKATNSSSLTTEGLWGANKCFIERYGAKQAALDIFRVFLQRLSDKDLDYGMRRKLIKEEDLNTVSLHGDLELSTVEKAMRLLSGLRRPSLLFKLKTVADYMGKIKEHYRKFPEDPSGLDSWLADLQRIYDDFLKKL